MHYVDDTEDHVRKELISMMQGILQSKNKWFVKNGNYTDVNYICTSEGVIVGLLITYVF